MCEHGPRRGGLALPAAAAARSAVRGLARPGLCSLRPSLTRYPAADSGCSAQIAENSSLPRPAKVAAKVDSDQKARSEGQKWAPAKVAKCGTYSYRGIEGEVGPFLLLTYFSSYVRPTYLGNLGWSPFFRSMTGIPSAKVTLADLGRSHRFALPMSSRRCREGVPSGVICRNRVTVAELLFGQCAIPGASRTVDRSLQVPPNALHRARRGRWSRMRTTDCLSCIDP